MGFASSGFDSSKQNRDLRYKGAPFEGMKNNAFINPPELEFKKVSPEEVKRVTRKYKIQQKFIVAVQNFLIVSITILICFGIWKFLF